jgi:glycosyltransferase involved in cell wall biosynthesis
VKLAWFLLDMFNPVMAWRVARIVRRERPDVMQTSNLLGFSCAVWLVAKSLRIPVVQMLHDYYPVCGNSSTFKDGHNCERPCRKCRVVTAPRRALSGIPVSVISLSDRTLSKTQAFGGFGKVASTAIIHGASSLTPKLVQHVAGSAAFTVGYLGRVERNKGIETVIEALRASDERGTRFLIAGQGPDDYIRELKDLAQGLDVEFMGRVKPTELFCQIEALIVPSMWDEPLGRVIYEAYGEGIPCIVSSAGGMPEIVEEGVTGHVFKVGVPAELLKALRLFKSRGLPFYRDACIEKSTSFHVSRVMPQYLAVWQAAAHPAI